jgi:hypothetical protein
VTPLWREMLTGSTWPVLLARPQSWPPTFPRDRCWSFAADWAGSLWSWPGPGAKYWRWTLAWSACKPTAPIWPLWDWSAESHTFAAICVAQPCFSQRRRNPSARRCLTRTGRRREKAPGKWATNLADMNPPAEELIRLGLSMSPMVVIRLPRRISTNNLKDALGWACNEMGTGGNRWRWLVLQKP